MRTLPLLALATLALPAPAHACVVPPQHLVTPHPELVRRSPRIAIARFEKATRAFPLPGVLDDRPTLHFRTVEVIKGTVGPTFTLAFGGPQPADYKDRPGADFHGHRDGAFWEEHITRQWNGADCQMHPRFEVGATYLVFLDPPHHWRSFERIDRPDDRWLAAVKRLVARPALPSGLIQPLAEVLGEQDSILIGEVSGCYLGSRGTPIYPHEVKVREVLAGKPRQTLLFSNGGFQQCEVGALVLALVRAFPRPPDDPVAPGRLLPLLDGKGHPAAVLSDGLHVDFNAGSEAGVGDTDEPTIRQLRELVRKLRR